MDLRCHAQEDQHVERALEPDARALRAVVRVLAQRAVLWQRVAAGRYVDFCQRCHGEPRKHRGLRANGIEVFVMQAQFLLP